MKFRVEGKPYEFDLESLTLDEGELLEDYAGLTVEKFTRALAETRVKAIRVMVLIAKRRAGEQVEWADLGGLDLMELAMSMIEENDIDLAAATNGQNPAAVAALADQLAARKRAAGKRSKTTA